MSYSVDLWNSYNKVEKRLELNFRGLKEFIKVTFGEQTLDENLNYVADSLGRKGNENLLIKMFLEEFEKISEMFIHEKYEEILKEWRKRSYTIGKIVEVRKPFNKYYDGYVIGISREGALVVEKIDGSLEKVISGECIIKN